MIVRKVNSLGSHHREGAGSSTGPAPKSHIVPGHHRRIDAEARDNLLNNLPDQPGLVALVGVNGTVRPFLYLPFHRS